MKYLHLTLIALIIGAFNAFAQPTGDFVRSFVLTSPDVAGDTLDIYFHIPSGFDFNQPAKMIIGQHGLGTPDNSMQIRQFLTPVGDSLNAIVMCPDPYLQDQPKSRASLNEALDSAFSWYSNINGNELYIAGYSAGSDVAAKYVLESPKYYMKGLIWHSPGFFANPSNSALNLAPPICLCWGDADAVSIIQNNALDNAISSSDAPYHHITMPGVGHTMDYPSFPQVMMECINFIDNAAVGVEEQQLKDLRVYPNPAQAGGEIYLSGVEPNTQVQLIDVAGREYKVTKNGNSVQLPGGIAGGVYLLRVVSGNTIYNHKLGLVKK